MIGYLFKKVFGTKNDKELKKYHKKVAKINALEDSYKKLNDKELKNSLDVIKQEIADGIRNEDSVLADVFAIVREASVRILKLRHYDVQLVGGMVLNDGRVAEMKTGEGKTLVATLPVVLNVVCGKSVHIVTVNDYLAQRDAIELHPLYDFLGISVGVILSDLEAAMTRQEAYERDVVYGTNNEFGFDYLRDNMRYSEDELLQKEHHFAIVDEVDSILVDEARTPLIISGPVNRKMSDYAKSNDVALKLEKGEVTSAIIDSKREDVHSGDFIVDEKNRVILLTEDGIGNTEKMFGVENLYDLENAGLAHQIDQALKANYLFEKDVDYVVKDDEVIIVDEFTGRLSEGRRFSEGLHQALEAKERVKIKEESQTLADITFQNYFRLYGKLAGMTGTAQTEATEFAEIYNLDVISIPTNVDVNRIDRNDLIYKTEIEKFSAVVLKIKKLYQAGQPVLVGTASIEKSEYLHKLLKEQKVPHTVLNAKNHGKEAEIIMNAGKASAVTISTNMAGRGVDIKINKDELEKGGLFVLGTERHESRRIDNQLRGRSGRQGDAGESQFFLSLEDNLLRIFGGEKIKNIMTRLGIEEGEHIESRIVTKAVENAQKKVENMHFESRKHLLEYDDVANEQRKIVYNFRRNLLQKNYKLGDRVDENREDLIGHIFEECDIVDGAVSEDFNLDKLKSMFSEEISENFSLDEIKNKEYSELYKYCLHKIKSSYAEKMSVVIDDESRADIEKTLYLQILDNNWTEHLYQMDVLKTGIGLRGYNQKDPLVEYKKESYHMFMDFSFVIKLESYRLLHSVELRPENEEQLESMVKGMEIDESQLQLSSDDNTSKTVAKNPPRNASCPCGSGKKYKNCCGR
jgi:preprotein translocase subunit SecA